MAAPERRDGAPLFSVLVFLGEDATSTAALSWAARRAEERHDLEAIVVEARANPEVRAELRRMGASLHVVHQWWRGGPRVAQAIAAHHARGSYLLFALAGAALSDATLSRMERALGADPGVGIATLGAGGPNGAGRVVAVLVRAVALASIGGPAALEDAGGDPATGPLDLLPPAVLDELAAAGWRTAHAGAEDGSAAGSGGAQLAAATSEESVPEELRFIYDPVPVPPAASVHGMNVVGLFEAACGIGDSARRYAEAIARARIAHSTFAYRGHVSPTADFSHRGPRAFVHDTNLFVLNSNALPTYLACSGGEPWFGRYSIGMMFWEVELLPEAMLRSFSLFNELWAASRFLERVYGAAADRPVVYVPHPVPRRLGAPAMSKGELGLPEAFTFLSMFDFSSLALRKNPIGTIEAFCRAFSPGEGPVLVVKTLNAVRHPEEMAALRRAVGGRRDILVRDEYLSEEETSQMIGQCDCFVSLHRAEGFGLTPAEAMAWGRPVIATAWSGNLDFMTEDNSYLVPARLVPVPGALANVYPPGSRWAEPDIDAAAAAMRSVYEAQDAALTRARRGRDELRKSHSPEAVAKVIAARHRELASSVKVATGQLSVASAR